MNQLKKSRCCGHLLGIETPSSSKFIVLLKNRVDASPVLSIFAKEKVQGSQSTPGWLSSKSNNASNLYWASLNVDMAKCP